MLAPFVITDSEVVMSFDDATAECKWGLCLRGPQYRAVIERWYDDLWASIPESNIICSHTGFNEAAIERIRKEIVTLGDH